MTLVRITVAVGLLGLSLLCLALSAFLGFLGYVVSHSGFPKSALALFAAACCPLALLGIVVAFTPDWLDRLTARRQPKVLTQGQQLREPTPEKVRV